VSRVKVSADGHGVVCWVGMLREVAELTGLSAQVTPALADTYRSPRVEDAGAVFDAHCIPSAGQPVNPGLRQRRERVRWFV
jgi:hypothetical protein